MLDYYFSLTTIDKHIYSIDMIRINFELNDELNNSFSELINNFDFNDGCSLTRYISKSGLGYHYLYNLKIQNDTDKCSFSIGTGLLCKKENENKGFIEFNPNKCFKLPFFNKFFNELKKICYSFKIKRYDVAIDIPIKRDLVKMLKSSKCNYELLHIYKSEGTYINNSITEYQGRRNHNKFTKLYDKTKESNLDYDLTRIEFTFDRNEVAFINLPNFYITKNDLDLTNKDTILISLLLNSVDTNFFLKKLNYRTRKRLEPYLIKNYISIDIILILCLRDKVLSFEF